MKKCLFCGETIQERRRNALYCSASCYLEAKKERDHDFYHSNRKLKRDIEASDTILGLFYTDGKKITVIPYQSLKDAKFNFGLSTSETIYAKRRFTVLNRFCYSIRDNQSVMICKLK